MTESRGLLVQVGEVREDLVVADLTRTQLVQYAGASGDYNPLHTDEVFARECAGVPTVFGHGMLTMAMTGRLLTDWFGPARIVSYGARFVAQVWPGDSLTVTATVDVVEDDLARVALLTKNQRGEVVLTGDAAVNVGLGDYGSTSSPSGPHSH
jgi:acyl dehydratase